MNVIYRLGDHLCVRLPRVQRWAQDLDKELHWLPKLAPRLPLRVPEPIGKVRDVKGAMPDATCLNQPLGTDPDASEIGEFKLR